MLLQVSVIAVLARYLSGLSAGLLACLRTCLVLARLHDACLISCLLPGSPDRLSGSPDRLFACLVDRLLDCLLAS